MIEWVGGIVVAAFFFVMIYIFASVIAEHEFAVCIIPGQKFVHYETLDGGYCTPDPRKSEELR